MASLPKDFGATSMLDLRKMITELNSKQRIFFDEQVERCLSDDSEAKPSRIYLAGEAGTGKSRVVKVLVAALKNMLAKSGQDLNKQSVLIMAPSATAAFLIDGVTIESGLKFNMSSRVGNIYFTIKIY